MKENYGKIFWGGSCRWRDWYGVLIGDVINDKDFKKKIDNYYTYSSILGGVK